MTITKKIIEQSNGRFLIKSGDTYLVEEFLREFRDILKDTQYIVRDDLNSFIESCNSSSLFGSDRRIIVLHNIDKEYLESLLEIVERSSDDYLIFVESIPLLKTKIYTKIKSICTFIELKDPSESERAVIVKRWMATNNMRFGDEIPSYIVSSSGANLNSLRNEVKKLKMLLSVHSDKIVTKELCDKLISSNSGSNYFVFMDYFFKKKFQELLSEFYKVDEYSYIKLLHFMIGQVDRAYKIAIYKDQGMNADQISEIIGVPTFIVKTKMLSVLIYFGKVKLLLLLDLLNKLDIELRSTKYPKSDVFLAYLIKSFKL